MASQTRAVVAAVAGTAGAAVASYFLWTRYGWARVTAKYAALWDDATATTSGGQADANIQAPLGAVVRRAGAPVDGYQPVKFAVAGADDGKTWWIRTNDLGSLL